jgi:hypothetical protein
MVVLLGSSSTQMCTLKRRPPVGSYRWEVVADQICPADRTHAARVDTGTRPWPSHKSRLGGSFGGLTVDLEVGQRRFAADQLEQQLIVLGLRPEISPVGAFTIRHLRRLPLREILRVSPSRVTGTPAELCPVLACAVFPAPAVARRER